MYCTCNAVPTTFQLVLEFKANDKIQEVCEWEKTMKKERKREREKKVKSSTRNKRKRGIRK